jgi:hypothetical protein
MILPTFLGIGAPKCATTWLYNCLDAHPEIFVSDVKETNFFVFDTIDGRLDEYTAHFEEAFGARAVGEVSVSYISSNVAPRRAHTHIPDAQLFASLRNPIDQTYSYYWHLQRQNFHGWDLERVNQIQSFEDTFEHIPNQLLEPGFHYRNLQRWLQYFDRSQLHVLLLDDVKEDAGCELARLYEHLGVDPTFRPSSMRTGDQSARRGTSPRGPLVERVRQLLYYGINRCLYHPLKRMVGQYRADRLKEALRLRQIMEQLFRKDGYPDMNPDTRDRLKEVFEDDIQKLEDFLDRDLSHWT